MQPITELVQISAAGSEPLAVDTAKDWLRVDTTEDDALIGTLCTAARDHAERFCRRSFKVGDVWSLTMNMFPLAILDDQIFLENPESEFWGTDLAFPYYSQERFSIEVPRGPISAVNSITYYDTSNTQQTLDPATWQLVQEDDANPRIYPVFPNWWPLTSTRPDAVTVNFTAGGVLPALVQTAMMQLVGHWYRNREGVVITSSTAQKLPLQITDLLWQYREMEF